MLPHYKYYNPPRGVEVPVMIYQIDIDSNLSDFTEDKFIKMVDEKVSELNLTEDKYYDFTFVSICNKFRIRKHNP